MQPMCSRSAGLHLATWHQIQPLQAIEPVSDSLEPCEGVKLSTAVDTDAKAETVTFLEGENESLFSPAKVTQD